MNINPTGSVTISGLAVLLSPWAVDPQKGPRNVVFDANFYIVEGSETGTMALLRYFASNEMTVQIQKMADKPYQKAFIVAHVNFFFYNYLKEKDIISFQIASIQNSKSINNLTSDFEISDYAFVGDIYQVRLLNNMTVTPYLL